jgi:hypothetical protein
VRWQINRQAVIRLRHLHNYRRNEARRQNHFLPSFIETTNPFFIELAFFAVSVRARSNWSLSWPRKCNSAGKTS